MYFRFDPSGYYVPDGHGWQARGDFAANANGRTGLWGVSGQSPNAGEAPLPFANAEEAIAAGQLYRTPDDALRALGPRPAGPTASENAYNAALQAQGIDPSELPMGSSGQEATARVLQQHGQALPDWLKAYAPTPAGGGHSARPGLAGLPDGGNYDDPNTMSLDDSRRLMLLGTGNFREGQAPVSQDPFTNGVAGKFLARTAEESNAQNQKALREFIRKVLLNGQGGARPPVSPHLIRAAMGRAQ